MIITASDDRNYQFVMDGIQAKMLVELLRQVISSNELIPLVIGASLIVNQDGFETTGSDVIAAATSVVSVLGFWTKQLSMRKPQAAEAAVEEAQAKEAAPVEEDVDGNRLEVPPKPAVN